MQYLSQFTGAEIDKAVGELLGNTYGNEVHPGCMLAGTQRALPQELRRLVKPGSYTLFFFYDGPQKLETCSPIRMRVYYDADDRLIQWIMHGTCIFWRNLLDPDADSRYEWKEVELAEKQVVVEDVLTSDSPINALSANMGRVLKMLIDGLRIGGPNLLVNSAFNRNYGRDGYGWNFVQNVTRFHAGQHTGYFIDINDVYYENEESHTEYISPQIVPTNIQTEYMQNINAVVLDASTKNAGELTEFGPDISLMPQAHNHPQSYTASVYLADADFTSCKTGDYGDYITVFIQIGVHSNVAGTFKAHNEHTIHIFKDSFKELENRISVTLDYDGSYPGKLDIAFGISGPGKVTFAAPKLEQGSYATAWTMNFDDYYAECVDARKINDIPIDYFKEDWIHNQQGLVYDAVKGEFAMKFIPLGVEGSGGFIPSTSSPKCSKVLWLDRNDHAGYLKYYDSSAVKLPSDSPWVRIPVEPAILSNTEIGDPDKLWLDTTTQNTIRPATINYYDPILKKWRPCGAAPGKCWEESLTPPLDNSLLWIHEKDHIMRFYSKKGQWEIVHAAWGENTPED